MDAGDDRPNACAWDGVHCLSREERAAFVGRTSEFGGQFIRDKVVPDRECGRCRLQIAPGEWIADYVAKPPCILRVCRRYLLVVDGLEGYAFYELISGPGCGTPVSRLQKRLARWRCHGLTVSPPPSQISWSAKARLDGELNATDDGTGTAKPSEISNHDEGRIPPSYVKTEEPTQYGHPRTRS